jgi:phage/plasmid-like protein (TIGR03299 family)
VAHDLNIENGKASMMYVGKEPWHGLGTKLDGPATAGQAIVAAKLDWEVEKQPLFAVGVNSRGTGSVALAIQDKFAVVRRDKWGDRNCPVLGIVGAEYTPLQNWEAFSFFDAIVDQEAAIYHTAGALGQGERVWILAKLPSDIRDVGDDIANKFLLLSNSHDGNSSVQIKFTPIRVVCQNTFTMALSQGPTIRVAHTRDLRERLKFAEKALGLIKGRFDEIENSFQAMAKVKMNQERMREYFNLVLPNSRAPEDEQGRNRAEQDRAAAEHYYRNGWGNRMKGVSETLWAAYNGVTEYIDHRQSKQTRDRRLNSIWFGDGYLVKARAFKVAEEKIKPWASLN